MILSISLSVCFMAVVTLHVTSANHPVESSFGKAYVSASEDCSKAIASGAIEFMRKEFHQTPQEMQEMMTSIARDLHIDDIVGNHSKGYKIIDTMKSKLEYNLTHWEVVRMSRKIFNFTSIFLEKVQRGEWESSAFSPYIIHASLSLAAFFAKGQRRVLLDGVLADLGLNRIRYDDTAYEYIIRTVNDINPKRFKLKLKYFYSPNWRLKCGFEDRAKQIFRTESQALDFAQSLPDAKTTILEWMRTETDAAYLQDDLQYIKAGLNSNTAVVVATVGYYKGALKRSFEFAQKAFFQTRDISNKKNCIDYYYREGDYVYIHLDEINAQLIELPLTGSDDLSLLVILPDNIGDCTNVLYNIQKMDLEKLHSSKKSRVKIYMPKIYYSSIVDVTEAVRNMGLKTFVGPHDDSDAIREVDAHIDKIYQATVIDIATKNHRRKEKEEKLRKLIDNEPIFQFNVTSSFIYAIISANPLPIFVYVGQSE